MATHGSASTDREPRSPLDGVLRSHGAAMAIRHGRCVAAHFGSAASEAAVCLRTVGIADRSERTTIELRGAPGDIEEALAAHDRASRRGSRPPCRRVRRTEEALAALGPPDATAWWARTTARSAIVRCEYADAPQCAAAVLSAEGALDIDFSNRYAAIGVVGPLAEDLLQAANFDDGDGQPIVMQDRQGALELLVDASDGARVWTRLLEAGAPFRVACVGLDALEHLAVSHRFPV
jgi:glycine cleavage system aminomethyltransferase T